MPNSPGASAIAPSIPKRSEEPPCPRTASSLPTLEALERARGIASIVEAGAQQAQDERTLPEKTVKAMKEARVFRLFQPKVVGGDEADFATQVAVVEELSRADGSAGWNSIANGPSSGFAAAYLSDEAA